jgi:hypothetical protein
MKRDAATVQTAPELAFVDADQLGRLLHAQGAHVSQQDCLPLVGRKTLDYASHEGQDLVEPVGSLGLSLVRRRLGGGSDVA